MNFLDYIKDLLNYATMFNVYNTLFEEIPATFRKVLSSLTDLNNKSVIKFIKPDESQFSIKVRGLNEVYGTTPQDKSNDVIRINTLHITILDYLNRKIKPFKDSINVSNKLKIYFNCIYKLTVSGHSKKGI